MTKDPFRYFRIEARELLDALSEGVLRLEKNPQDAEALASLLRQAHTLKGAARVVKQGELARVAHAFEELLAPVRSGTGPVSRVEADGLFKLLDAGQSALAALDPPGQVKPHHPPPSQKDPAPPTPVEAGAGTAVLDTMRVEVAEVDAILREISEAGGRLNGLRDELHTLRQAQELATAALQPSSLLERAATVRPVLEELRTLLSRSSAKLERSLEGAVRDLSEARNTVHRLRLLPAATVFPALARAVRDAAGLLGKEVDFSTAGGEHRLDAHVLSAVRDAFVHVVRNAVDHGIEPGEARTAAGKPPRGRVVLAVEARGNQMAFICEDDGRGVDAEAVRRAARERGLPPPSDEEAAIRLVLSGGFSTAREATQVSGRGVGLDVLHDTAARVKGTVTAESRPGHGTRVELRVPVSLSAGMALQVEAGDKTVSLPLAAVREVVGLSPGSTVRTPSGDCLTYAGAAVPFAPLHRILAPPGAPEPPSPLRAAVVLTSVSGLAAVGVHRLKGTAAVMVRPLPQGAAVSPVVAGASLDARDEPRLALDPDALASAVRQAASGPQAPTAPRIALPVLVIDDSLTTRMLEQSILEAAGFRVEVASSAEEGLAKARVRRHGLFIVDVEMPGMNGFEFVARTRADPELSQTPAMLVTSRGSPEDLRRGEEAGARAHLIKSEFDQNRFLDTVRSLLGR